MGLREVKCSFCKNEIPHNEHYFRYLTGDIGCWDCDNTHGTENSSMYVRGVSDWWEAPTDEPSGWPYGEDNFEYGFGRRGAASSLEYNRPVSEERRGVEKVEEKEKDKITSLLVCKEDSKIVYGDITVVLTQEVFNQIFSYVDISPIEISGLGRVRRIIKDNKVILYIEEAFLLKQKNTAASTHLDPAALSEFIRDRVDKNIDNSDLKLWWHSHVDMGAFWSGTDDACCESLDPEGDTENRWNLSIVVNKRREMRARLDIYSPYRMIIDGLPVRVEMAFSQTDRKRYEKEVDEKCSDKSNWLGFTPRRETRPRGVSEDEIERAYSVGKEDELRYVNDMSGEGVRIEALHYKHGLILYKLFSGNSKVPEGHKVPNLKNLQKTRPWYLDRNGIQCHKSTTDFMKKSSEVSTEEKIIFYKRLLDCSCEWCAEQGKIIESCEKVVKESQKDKKESE